MKGEMKKEIIKGGDIGKRRKKTQREWGWKKQENKQNKGAKNQTKKPKKKPKWWWRKRKNQKKGFHEMAIEFDNPSQIHLTPSDGNQNGFNCHHWMMNKMDLITTIWFDRHCWMETEKRGIWQAHLLLVSVGHKDGWL
jgi:hypothetical protein